MRVVAATNRDLEPLIRQGTFREDLFYRLNVIPIVLPPLRERREDIPLLAELFLGRFAERQGRALRLSAGAMERLFRYAWPGNVRELENAMERTAILARGDTIEPSDYRPTSAPALPRDRLRRSRPSRRWPRRSARTSFRPWSDTAGITRERRKRWGSGAPRSGASSRSTESRKRRAHEFVAAEQHVGHSL